MSLIAIGSTNKTTLENDVAFVKGDVILCNTGVDLCSAILLKCVEANINADSFFTNAYSLAKLPAYGAGQTALPMHFGHTISVEEVSNVYAGDTFTVLHPSDPRKLRHAEVWITYFPSSAYSLDVFEKDANILETSLYISIKPLIYPELVQTIPTPGHTTGLPGYDQISGSNGGEYIVLFSAPSAIALHWNGSQYDTCFEHTLGSATVCASIDGGSAIVTYYDNIAGEYKIAFYEDNGSWYLDRTESWAYAAKGVQLTGNFIIVDGQSTASVVLNKADLSIYHTADDTNYLNMLPVGYKRYCLYTDVGYGYDTSYISVLGGPYRQVLAYSEVRYNTEYFRMFGSAYSEGYSPYLPDGEEWVSFSGALMHRQPMGRYPDEGVLIRTSHNELFLYDLLDGEYSASLDLRLPSQVSNGYVFENFLVNFNYQVSFVVSPTELVYLYNFDAATHKIWTDTFCPVIYPYFMTHGTGETVDLIEVVPTHYNEMSPAVVTLRCVTEAPLATTDDFTYDQLPVGTSATFLLSADNSTFYKWSGTAWVTETDIANGNTPEDFAIGCQQGFSFPENCVTAYVKAQLSSTVRDYTPTFTRTNTKLHLTTISSDNEAHLADDSKVSIVFTSDTETTITSKISQNVNISAQVCLIAPAYDQQYEG